MPGRSVTHVSERGAPAPPLVVGPVAPALEAGAVRANLWFPGYSAPPSTRRLRATGLTALLCPDSLRPGCHPDAPAARFGDPRGRSLAMHDATRPLFLPDPPTDHSRSWIRRRQARDLCAIERTLSVLRAPARA